MTNANPVKVINMSLGSTGPCTGSSGTLYREAFQAANDRGAVVVVAAGNSAGEPVDSPANCSGAIAVTGLQRVAVISCVLRAGETFKVWSLSEPEQGEGEIIRNRFRVYLNETASVAVTASARRGVS